MKALTVRQPWAWAIAWGGKNIENRTQAWKHRGPLAIHAGAGWDDEGAIDPRVVDAAERIHRQRGRDSCHVGDLAQHAGVIVAVVQLVDVHHADPAGCCAPWGQPDFDELDLTTGRTRRRRTVHLVLDQVRPLERPIAVARGALGLWDLNDDDVVAAIDKELTAHAR